VTSAHGTRSRYTQGCRCDGCRAANLAYSKAYIAARPEKADRRRETSREAMRRLRARRRAEAEAQP
jgi:hypothetical protein